MSRCLRRASSVHGSSSRAYAQAERFPRYRIATTETVELTEDEAEFMLTQTYDKTTNPNAKCPLPRWGGVL